MPQENVTNSNVKEDRAKLELEKAKVELDKALLRIERKEVYDDFELGRIASGTRALFDINGVC